MKYVYEYNAKCDTLFVINGSLRRDMFRW